MHKVLLTVTALAGGGVLLALLTPAAALPEKIERVLVTNFPELQQIHGTVTARGGPLAHAELVTRRDVLVPPVGREETTNLIAAGTVETAGWTSMVLSLQGEVQDTVFDPGTVGAVLVPDQEPVLRALREEGRYQFPAEVTAETAPAETALFSSRPTEAPVAFPSYRIFLYNGGDKTAEVNLYLYLRN